MAIGLTKAQKRILDFVVKDQAKNGFPPSVREICKAFGFASTRSAVDHLAAIERKGFIHRDDRRARGIRILEPARKAAPAGARNIARFAPPKPERAAGNTIPLLGRIAAGSPIDAVETADETLDLGALYGSRDVFAVKVAGNSMVDAAILDGDYVVVRKDGKVSNGDIAVAYVDGEATVKRFFVERDAYRLQPENPAMEPIRVSKSDPRFSLGGKVVGVIRRVARG